MNKMARRDFLRLAGLGAAVFACGPRAFGAPAGKLALVEAENFDKLGGWAVDQQFMDQMGSPYLLAHGLGEPVADATTSVTLPAAGKYRVWVRTCDWVAKWQAPGAPGRFNVIVNGKTLGPLFGTEGADWHWQDGGTVETGAKAALALHDQMGFEGRCDAVLFSQDLDFRPPDAGKELAALRQQLLGLPEQPEDGGSFELVVVGGGIAGMCAALAAARSGMKTALIQDRPVLGGNNSSEVRVWLGGNVRLKPLPNIGNLVGEFEPKKRAHDGATNTAEIYEDDKREKLMKSEKNLTLLFNQRLISANMGKSGIAAVVAQDIRTGRRLRYAGELFADCTGDGQLGALAGAEFEVTQKQHMGPSNLWHAIETREPADFPHVNWALDLTDKPFPGRATKDSKTGKLKPADLSKLGQWFWETGFDLDPVTEVEKMRDWNLRAMYGAWDALKNADKLFPNHKLHWAAFIAGKRESRRLLGDVLLNKEDVVGDRKFDDACFPCTWSLDLHYADKRYGKGFEGREFISEAHFGKFKPPYWAPYRCLYSRNVPNLFMAGRDISVTHDALGTVRVMRTCGAMGEVVGLAAALCRKFSATPRGLYESHRDALTAAFQKGAPTLYKPPVGGLPKPATAHKAKT